MAWEKMTFFSFHKKKGHQIDECIEFHQKVIRMLTLGELRIKAVKDSQGIEVVENLEKCKVQSTSNGVSKLVLTKSSYSNKIDYMTIFGNYGYNSSVKAHLPLF